MLSIQEGAQQIFSDNPGNLYFFTGPEYGVKVQYLEILENHYGTKSEYESLADLIDSLSSKSLIPRKPKLHVIRYDKNFVSKLSEYGPKLLKLKVPGTIVSIYDDDKVEAKLDKQFPKAVLRINQLTANNARKHLSKRFPDLPEMYINTAIELGTDYFQSQLICSSMEAIGINNLSKVSKAEFFELFGPITALDTLKFKTAIAARNFKVAIDEIEKYEGDLSLLFYDILATYLEIAKMLEKSYGDSFVKPYLNLWDMKSIKVMYDLTYEQLERLRSTSTYDPYNALVYVCALLKFKIS